MITRTKIPEDFVDTGGTVIKDFGVKLTNRVGTIKIGKQNEVNLKKMFLYILPSLIEWNGDVFLCPQDWQRRVAMGNIMQKSFEIWNGTVLNKFRRKHLDLIEIIPL